MLAKIDDTEIEDFVAALRKDYGRLAIRIRTIDHTIKCATQDINLRLNFPSIKQGRATITELVNTLSDYITPFALPQSQLNPVIAEYGKVSEEQYRLKREQLRQEAIDLFIKAHKATNRNGEAGELLLFLLTEWLLGAPQLIAKLCLKTDPNAPVLGTDGIHIGYSAEKKALIFYCGEAKLVADLGGAIAKAAQSLKDAFADENHEIRLVSRHIHLADLPNEQKEVLLRYLDPNEEAYNSRIDISTCLIGFNFDGFDKLTTDSTDTELAQLAESALAQWGEKLASTFINAGINKRKIEIFFFPLPSVQFLRDEFQKKIGWM